MNVKEVEEILQTTRANIRFYEKEGLLTPNRDANGYRSYSEENVKQLKKIILFRKLGISIPDIKKMFDEKQTLTAIISHNMLSLNRQMEEMKGALDICKRIEKDPDIDINFDIDTYWNVMEQERRAGKAFFDDAKDYIEFEGNVLKMFGVDPFYMI